MTISRVEVPYGADRLVIETGKLAKQAAGAVTVSCGGTVVLVSACMAKTTREGIDFFPLTVEYQEKTYAAGRIPGGFFKREGRSTEKEILTSRLIDRPIRPLFPEGLFNEVQVIATVLSADTDNDPDVMAIIGASAALMISDIPFAGPISAVRVGLVDGQFIVNPTYAQRALSTLDFIVAGDAEGVVMIEGDAKEVPEAKIKEMLAFAHQALQPALGVQKELQKQSGKVKIVPATKVLPPAFVAKVRSLGMSKLNDVLTGIKDKKEREGKLNDLFASLSSDLTPYAEFKKGKEDITAKDVAAVFELMQYDVMRANVFDKGIRADGRGLNDIRALSSEVAVLPRTHGSALFTRGQTQGLATVTLGTKIDEQMMEGLTETVYRKFMLHYNFPSFSVGETKPVRGPGRREIGHGALAHRAVEAVMPDQDTFPYTVRVVSEILESNGSSSMATVCASTLALMDAGVPLKAPVAGISVGLISDEKRSVLIIDIQGMEDHFGDMDFKVAGSKTGITAIQLDLKIRHISIDLLGKAIDQAQAARGVILDSMTATLAEPRANTSEFAPRIATIQIPQDRIGEVIGPGGKTIRMIIETTGATAIDIDDDGKAFISAPDQSSLDKVMNYLSGLLEEPEIGKTYEGTVMRIMNFGAFCEFMPGKEGLVHVSELAHKYVKDPNEVVKVGDTFPVVLVEVDEKGRCNLSRKKAMPANPEQK
ncbi:MAG: polyribonucleotide nucleotidyltransferase [Candidatus Omnitrophica bacterium]|nr:polyribonucleotide nucleotidyltransferase [Candidatus Omnitrophota bacterium]